MKIIGFIAAMAALIWLIVQGTFYLAKADCLSKWEVSGYKAQFVTHFGRGLCLVEIDGKWLPEQSVVFNR